MLRYISQTYLCRLGRVLMTIFCCCALASGMQWKGVATGRELTGWEYILSYTDMILYELKIIPLSCLCSSEWITSQIWTKHYLILSDECPVNYTKSIVSTSSDLDTEQHAYMRQVSRRWIMPRNFNRKHHIMIGHQFSLFRCWKETRGLKKIKAGSGSGLSTTNHI